MKQDTSESCRKENRGERLAQGLEALVEERATQHRPIEALVVGTGYGGAVAAAELAAAGVQVYMLERGLEYLPGEFPSRLSELAGHVQMGKGGSKPAKLRREGLFDVRMGEDVSVVLANGLGGGSLINAGVMEWPQASVLGAAAWPKLLRDDPNKLASWRDRIQPLLGAGSPVQPNTLSSKNRQRPLKTQALAKLAGEASFRELPLTIALDDAHVTSGGVHLKRCTDCGDCATGCNEGAKDSLDANLLARAVHHGARIFTGATVLRLSKAAGDAGWDVQVLHTDEKLRRRQRRPLHLRARRVILAAGCLGSTEILLRSESEALKFSGKLGLQFSANGDVAVAAFDLKDPVQAIADEGSDPARRDIGPTITGMADLREGSDSPLVVQDVAVPGALRRVFEETFTTSETLHLLAEADCQPHLDGSPNPDPCAVDPDKMRRTLPLAMMGLDKANGRIVLHHPKDGGTQTSVHVEWPGLRDDPHLVSAHATVAKLMKESGLGGRLLPNPLWKLLPDDMDFLLSGERGTVLTVHPLGGCPMADSVHEGVVDHLGRVFDPRAPASSPFHEGLAVLDGSVIPCALGINPALTIAAVALRAITTLIDAGWVTRGKDRQDKPPERHRELLRRTHAMPPRPTMVEVVERLSGDVCMSDDGGVGNRFVELTLKFAPTSLQNLFGASGERVLHLDPLHSTLRVFRQRPVDPIKEPDDAEACFVAPLSGRLEVLHRERSATWVRLVRCLPGWFFNRGMRDAVLAGIDDISGTTPPKARAGKHRLAAMWRRVHGAFLLATRGGEVRRLRYVLHVAATPVAPIEESGLHEMLAGRTFVAEKRLTYHRRCNPWRQLTRVTLHGFPHARNEAPAPVLELDPLYLTRIGVPLMRIVGQQDQPTALADLASFALYVARMLAQVHIWTFRLPDTPPSRDIDRWPGHVPGLPEPEIRQLWVGNDRPAGWPHDKGEVSVHIRLTRYKGRTSNRVPVLLIHGYSASGTTFAHHSAGPKLAEALCKGGQGRDVWIVDLRTSSAAATASLPWSFEQVAYADLPLAIDHVLSVTGQAQVDVVAHCMGSAMLCMALLGEDGDTTSEPFPELRKQLPGRIRHLVLSQVAPTVVFTPANVLRSYLMRYLRHYLPLEDYRFRVDGPPRLLDQLIDRLLASLPYPEEEFDIENPPWPPWRRTPWVGTRHRMGALYGRDFNLPNVPQSMLDHIDDYFGPLSLETVAQAIHFARHMVLTDKHGVNRFVSPAQVARLRNIRILYLHGEENGLTLPYTRNQFVRIYQQANPQSPIWDAVIPGTGHQDSLVGRRAVGEVFGRIRAFLDNPCRISPAQGGPHPALSFIAEPPVATVRAAGVENGQRLLGIGDTRSRGTPGLLVVVNIMETDLGVRLVDFQGRPQNVTATQLSLAVRLATVGPVDPGDPTGRQLVKLPAAAWVNGADGLLVLLVYSQFPELEPLLFRSLPDTLLDWQGYLDAIKHAWRQPKVPIPPLYNIGLEQFLQLLQGSLLPAIARGVNSAAHRRRLATVPAAPPLRNTSDGSAPPRCFALGCCRYPTGLLDSTPSSGLDRPSPGDWSYARLAECLGAAGKECEPSFLVLTGDQVYVDATAGLFDPATLDDRYRVPYENWYANPAVRDLFRRLPVHMLLDDHEIRDNWQQEPGSDENQECLERGLNAYWRYQRDGTVGADHRTVWGARVLDGLPFFFADTRSEREEREARSVLNKSIMGPEQWIALRSWLKERTGARSPRFVVSPSMVLPRLDPRSRSSTAVTALRSDAWDGYPRSLYELLAVLYEANVGDVVFLSGDAHLACTACIEIRCKDHPDHPGRIVTIHSIHAPPMYAPYPFANARPEDFLTDDAFSFRAHSRPGRSYQCTVHASFAPPGDGFALVTVSRDPGASWSVAVDFDLAPAAGTGARITVPAARFKVPTTDCEHDTA